MTAPKAQHSANKPPIIYKYTDLHGAQKILANRTLRFARPSEMNDPFDVYVDDILGMDLEEFFEKSRSAFVDLFIDDPEGYSEKLGENVVSEWNKLFLSKDPSETEKETARAVLKAQVAQADQDPALHALMPKLIAQKDAFRQQFAEFGIFCATRSNHNILMWAHYAEQHRGCVLGFRPALEKDSLLGQIEPVSYGPDRAHLFEEGKQILIDTTTLTPERATDRAQKLLLSKSAEWSYEEEWRLCVPGRYKTGVPASFLGLFPEELAEVYLGYRMSNGDRSEIARSAREVNSGVQVFAAKLAKRKYTLEFETIAE